MADLVTCALLLSSAVMIFFSAVMFLRLSEGVVQEKVVARKSLPFVTIAVPAWNEEDSLRETVLSAMSIEYPKNKFEVIMIDDGSTDGTGSVAKQLLQEFRGRGFNLHLIVQENKGKAAALNAALKKARGEFFACLDADSFADRSAVKLQVDFFSRNDVDGRLAAVVPIMLAYRPRKIVELFQQFEYVMSSFFQRISGTLDTLFVTPGPLSMYRADVLRLIGGFSSETVTEDQEIGYRLQSHHYRMKQCSQSFVWTRVPTSWYQLYRQRRRWQFGGLQCLAKYKRLLFNPSYGDFGLFQIPMNIMFYFLSLTGLVLFAYVNGRTLRDWWRVLDASGFDIMTLIRNASWHVNVLSMNVFAIVLLSIGLLLSFVTLFFGHDNARLKFSLKTILLFLPFAFTYYVFRAFVLLSLIPKAFQRKARWW